MNYNWIFFILIIGAILLYPTEIKSALSGLSGGAENIYNSHPCTGAIENDIDTKKKTGGLPFKVTYSEVYLVNGPEGAKEVMINVLGDYAPDFVERFPEDNISYIGLYVVEITEGQTKGSRGAFFYGCDDSGEIFHRPVNAPATYDLRWH